MKIENAVSDLKSALDKDDLHAIQTKTAALAEASGSLAQKLYAEQAQQPGGDGGSAGTDAKGDDVVDAEFEEVDDDKKSKSN